MRLIADGAWQLDGFPSHQVNAYLVDGVLFDCRTRWDGGHILRSLRGHRVSTVALTHAHPDHCGAAAEVCAGLNVPLVCHEHEVGLVRGEAAPPGEHWNIRAGRAFFQGGGWPEVRSLRDGDVLKGFRVVHTPGHSRGHVAYIRERDGLAVTGDLFSTMAPWSRRRRLEEPPHHLSVDHLQNRGSIRRLLELRPSVILPGHGPVLRDMAALHEWAAALDTVAASGERSAQPAL